jgi:DNA-binding transcriptional MerR regulator
VALPRTYTVYELEALSGFDKRTITYYISEGLLPKVGRRGPKTTYPREFLDRLMFIKRCRDLQDDGQLRAVTLAEIADVMQALPAEEFRQVAQGQRSDDWIRERFVEPDWNTSGRTMPAKPAAADLDDFLGDPVDRTTLSASPRMASMRQRRERMQMRSESTEAPNWSDHAVRSQAPDAAFGESANKLLVDSMSLAGVTDDMSAELARLGELMRMVQARAQVGTQQTTHYSGERLMRVPITDDIMLSVRNISDDDAPLVEELCRVLQKVMGAT